MAAQESFQKSIKITKFALKRAGINLDKLKHENSLQLLKHNWFYIFNTIWIQSTVVSEIAWCWQKVLQSNEGFAVLTFLAPCITYGILGTIKTAYLLFYGTMLKELLSNLERMFPSKQTNEDTDEREDDIIQESMTLLKMVVSVLFYVDLALFATYGGRPLWVLMYKYLMYGKVELTLPLDMSYPFDPLDWHVWPFTYFYQLWAAFLSTVNFIGGDTMFFVCCTHIYMHLRILRLRLETFITGDGVEDEVERKFIELVKKHQKLIELVEMLEAIFTKSNFFNYVASSFLICLTGFNVTTLHDKYTAVIFLLFLSSNVSQIFLICLFGDMIMDSSSKICDGMYHCKWYSVSTKTRKDIAFVLARSQKSCKLTAMQFAEVNLNTFTTILGRAWSYFALLNTLSTTSAGQQ